MAGLKLFDTNAMVAVNQGSLSVQADDTIAISIITRLELLSWPDLRDDQVSIFRSMVDAIETIPLTDAIEEHTIRLRSARLLKLPDAIVAATAIALNAPLVTNDQAFGRVPELRVETF